MKEISVLIDVLAFFASQRNYGYIDRLGNALDEVTAYEALRDALRDYYSVCVDRKQECCPDVNPEDLEKAIKFFISYISGKGGDVIVRETRKIALEALARRAKASKCEAVG